MRFRRPLNIKDAFRKALFSVIHTTLRTHIKITNLYCHYLLFYNHVVSIADIMFTDIIGTVESMFKSFFFDMNIRLGIQYIFTAYMSYFNKASDSLQSIFKHIKG